MPIWNNTLKIATPAKRAAIEFGDWQAPPGVYWGFGSPEGEVEANAGSLYLNADGGEQTLWVKQKGNDKRGWVAK